MKYFTIIFSALLVLGFGGMLAYVGISPEFQPPDEQVQEEDPNAPIWGMTLEEVLDELEKQGLIDQSATTPLTTSGLCSGAKMVNGAEFYWWNVEALEEDSPEETAYKSLKEEGFIDLFGSGSIMSPIHNGPFALLSTRYEGDEEVLKQAFRALGQSAPQEK